MGEEALWELANVLSKCEEKERFRELTLDHVKITTNHLNAILEVMTINCSLNKLCLSRLSLNVISTDLIIRILRNAPNLKSFSLAGSTISSFQLRNVLRVLSRNHSLAYVNLSFLSLGSQGDMRVTSKRRKILKQLCTFILKNEQLVHLDLSYSRLNNYQFFAIIEAAKQSHGLMSLHLTGNSISDADKDKALGRLGGTRLESPKFDTEYECLDLLYPINTQTQKKKVKVTKLADEQNYILWRVRGQPEIQFAETWFEGESCFLCDHWRYTLFLYSLELATKKYFPVTSTSLSKPPFFYSVEGRRAQALKDLTQKDNWAYMSCETYQWKMMRLMDIDTFCKKLAEKSEAKVTVRNLYGHLCTNAKMKPEFTVVNEQVQNLPLDSKLYLSVVLMPPTKHDIYFAITNTPMELWQHHVRITQIEEEVRAPPAAVRLKPTRFFCKPLSVFKFWYEDTPNNLKRLIAYDFERSKIKKLIRSEIDQRETLEVLNTLLPLVHPHNVNVNCFL